MPVVAGNVILSSNYTAVKVTTLSPGNGTKWIYRTYEKLGGMFNIYIYIIKKY
jgi:hypothetical protein